MEDPSGIELPASDSALPATSSDTSPQIVSTSKGTQFHISQVQESTTRSQTGRRALQTEIDNVEYICDFSSHQYECFHESDDIVKMSSFLIKNRLKKHIRFLGDELLVNVFIDSVITEGYKIPFDSEPSSVFCKNNASDLKYPNFFIRQLEFFSGKWFY